MADEFAVSTSIGGAMAEDGLLAAAGAAGYGLSEMPAHAGEVAQGGPRLRLLVALRVSSLSGGAW